MTPHVLKTSTPSPGNPSSITPTKSEPSNRLIPSSTISILIRKPSVSQINDFLISFYPDFVGFFEESEFEELDISGDGQPDSVYFDTNPQEGEGLIVYLAMVYEDINGDGESDLVIAGTEGTAIMIWERDHYLDPFLIPSSYQSSLEPPIIEDRFEDWTNDGVSEIIYDEKTTDHGTGYWISETKRLIIHCSILECQTIWEGQIAEDVTDYNSGGMAKNRTDISHVLSQSGKPAIRANTHGFSVICCWILSGPPPTPSLYVYTSTLSLYEWNGQEFAFVDQKIIRNSYSIDAQQNLHATSHKGVDADIIYNENLAAGNNNDVCQLLIDGLAVGERFGCRGNFTSMQWQDITNDNVDDLVITAYSAGYPYDQEGNL